MTLQQLRYILALDDHRNFGRAAEAMHVSQPTLTMQVKKLEQEMGFSVFNRKSTPVRPTQKGQEVIRRARRILGEANGLHAFVRGLQDSIAGRFRLGIIPTLAPTVLPRFLPDFLANHPETELVISEVQTQDMLEALHAETLDIGLCATPVDVEGIREIPCFHEPFVVFGRESDWTERGPLSSEDFDASRLLLLQEGHCFRDHALQVCGDRRTENQRPPQGFTVTSGSLESLKGLVRADLGFSLMPELAVEAGRDEEWVRELRSPRPSREVSLVCSEAFVREELLMTLRQAIREAVPAAYRDARSFRRIGWKQY